MQLGGWERKAGVRWAQGACHVGFILGHAVVSGRSAGQESRASSAVGASRPQRWAQPLDGLGALRHLSRSGVKNEVEESGGGGGG